MGAQQGVRTLIADERGQGTRRGGLQRSLRTSSEWFAAFSNARIALFALTLVAAEAFTAMRPHPDRCTLTSVLVLIGEVVDRRFHGRPHVRSKAVPP